MYDDAEIPVNSQIKPITDDFGQPLKDKDGNTVVCVLPPASHSGYLPQRLELNYNPSLWANTSNNIAFSIKNTNFAIASASDKSCDGGELKPAKVGISGAWLKRLTDKLEANPYNLTKANGLLDKFLADFEDADLRKRFLDPTDPDFPKPIPPKTDPIVALDIEVWKKFINLPDWVRNNVDLLDKLKGKDDMFLEKINHYYSVAMKRSTPSGFNGAGVYNGVKFNKYGHPELHSHVSSPNHIVEIDMKGNYTSDMTNAKDELLKKLNAGDVLEKVNPKGGWSPFYIVKNGIKEGPYTWHHHQNGKNMYPVKKEIHDKIIGMHSGGREIVLSYPELKDFFTEL